MNVMCGLSLSPVTVCVMMYILIAVYAPAHVMNITAEHPLTIRPLFIVGMYKLNTYLILKHRFVLNSSFFK